MAWETGTANGHRDLMDKLETFLTTHPDLVAASQTWTVNWSGTVTSYNMDNHSDPSQGYDTDFKDLYLKGPGLAGTDEIYIQLRAYEVPALSINNWMVAATTDYTPDPPTVKFEDQPNISNYNNQYYCYLTLVDSLITYWFVANGRRFYVVAKVGGDFYVMHAGFILPYALPSEYPYPIHVGACAEMPGYVYSRTDLTNFWKSELQRNAFLRARDGAWLRASEGTEGAGKVTSWPWEMDTDTGGYLKLIGNADGSFPLLPGVLEGPDDGGNVYGQYQGLCYIPALSPSTDAVAEDTITIGADTYLVLQNVDKTGRAQFAALKLE